MLGLVARWLFRVAPCREGTIHPCLLRDSNPGPTAQQSASLTTLSDGRLSVHIERITLTSHHKATRELLPTTLDLANPPLSYVPHHVNGKTLILDIFNVHRSPIHSRS
ncbi:hypothetical protein TNCV_3204751 [Trichonephila clavipes]|nr:hypothetical protein TNCV_3204751 [Trichonephila clavipes]